MSNIFYSTKDGKLDRQYLRICAVYRLLMRQKRIDKDRAIELLSERKVSSARATVELWIANPPKRFKTAVQA